MTVLLVADRGLQTDRLLGDLEHLAHLLERYGELFGQLLRRWFAADLVQHLPRGAHDLVEGLDHVHGDADRAGLVRNRAGDGLPDPPRRVGRKLVAAPVLELVDRLHQSNVSLLDQIQELQAAVAVFLDDGDHQAKVGFHQFLLGLTGLALTLLHGLDDAAVFGDLEPRFRSQRVNVGPNLVDLLALVPDELHPFFVAGRRHAVEPSLVQLVAEILVDEMLARHTETVGQLHQPAFVRDKTLVDRVELLDETLDAGVVERQALDVADDLVAQLVVATLLRAIELLARHLHLNLFIVQLAQPLVRGGNVVEGLEHLRLELGLHGGERQGALVLILVVELAFNAAFAAILGTDGGVSGGSRGRRHADSHGHRWRCLSLRPFVRRPQVDDVAQQDLGIHQLVAPNDDGLERQWTFAQARDHRLAAGLDALSDGDLALTREQLNRAHVAQVHAHGIVRALRRLGTRPRDRGNGRGDRYQTAIGPGDRLFVFIHGGLVHVALTNPAPHCASSQNGACTRARISLSRRCGPESRSTVRCYSMYNATNPPTPRRPIGLRFSTWLA